MTKFEINRAGFFMIADYLQLMNLEVIISIEPNAMIIHQFDTTRGRGIVIEYPIIYDGEPIRFATKTDWIFGKVNLLKGKTVSCEITESVLRLTQVVTVKDVKIIKNHDIALLDLEDLTIQDTHFEEEPTVEGTVFCELPDIAIFKDAINSMDSEDCYFSATLDQLLIESTVDYNNPASKISLFTPSIIKDEDNKVRQNRKEIASFLSRLKETTATTITFSKSGVLTIESTGTNIRIKLYSSPIEEHT